MARTTLVTDRLILRTVAESDAEAIAALADNYKIAIMLARLPYPYRIEHAHDFIARAAGRRSEEGIFGLHIKPDETFIGVCSYELRGGAEPEFGYWLGEPYWGEGYMSEAVSAVVSHAFTINRHAALRAGCRLQNLASRRVLEKAGFEHIGHGAIDSLVLKARLPGHRFRLTRERWQGLAA
ncbi:MAG: GNAT family N-acetyltransferase [Parvibaculaceae bacterium]